MKCFMLCLLVILSAFMFSGCQTVMSFFPTQTPYPTYTPNPTFTPYPTVTPTPSPTPVQVLFDESDFSGIDSCFSIVSTSDVRLYAEDGQYHIDVQEPEYYGWSICDNSVRNFILEVDATVVNGPGSDDFGYGVVLRGNLDDGELYAFYISPDGYYIFDYLHIDEVVDSYTILYGGPTREIKQGRNTNHLKVVAIGDQFEFYINGVLVGLVRDNVIRSGSFGFIVVTSENTGPHVSFDNLVITEP